MLQRKENFSFKNLELRRWGQIISLGPVPPAIENSFLAGESLAFHSGNLEFALLPSSLSSSMTTISLRQSQAPQRPTELNDDELSLEDWDLETSAELSKANENNLKLSKPKESLVSWDKVKSITLNVTQICNLHCHYCAAGGDGTYGAPQKKISIEKTLPQLQRMLSHMKSGEEFHVSFLGGEPLLYPEGMKIICEEITKTAKEVGFETRFKVTTNGTLLSDAIVDLFRKFNIEIVVSCDGPPGIQDKRRPGKAGAPSSDKVESTLRRLQSEKDLRFGLHAVFDSDHTEVLNTLKYFEQFSPHWIEFTYSVNKNDSTSPEAYLEELYQAAEYLYRKGGLAEVSRILTFKEMFQYLDRKQGIKNHCGIGKSFLVVDAKNDIYPCPWMVGSKKDLLWSGSNPERLAELEKFAKDLTDLHECQTCWAQSLCGGGCHFIHRQEESGKSLSYCERMRGTAMIALHFFGWSHAEQQNRTMII